MYQFSTTNIINSALDSNGVLAKYSSTSDVLNVARVGTFHSANIVSIFKRPYYASVKEVAKVTIPQVASGLVLRVELDIRLYDQTYSDYANTHMYFKKPVTVEILATNSAATDATSLMNQFNGIKDRFGYSYVVATVNSADLIITATDPNQQIFAITVTKEVASPNSIIQPEYTDITAGTFSVTAKGHPGFGDDNWMARRVTLPTYENVRYFGISKDERPILGGQYTEFVLRYKVEKDGQDGIVAGGYSITTHVFYVLSTLAAAFEAVLVVAFGDVLSVVSGGGVINVTSDDVTLANNATAQLTANGAYGTVAWAVVSGTSATVHATTGVVTAHATNDGETVIKATDAAGTVGTITITVA